MATFPKLLQDETAPSTVTLPFEVLFPPISVPMVDKLAPCVTATEPVPSTPTMRVPTVHDEPAPLITDEPRPPTGRGPPPQPRRVQTYNEDPAPLKAPEPLPPTCTPSSALAPTAVPPLETTSVPVPAFPRLSKVKVAHCDPAPSTRTEPLAP